MKDVSRASKVPPVADPRLAGPQVPMMLSSREINSHSLPQNVCFKCISKLRATRTPVYTRQATEYQARPLPVQAAEPEIDVFYRSTWSTVRLHGSLGGGPWQDFCLQPVSEPRCQPLSRPDPLEVHCCAHQDLSGPPSMHLVVASLFTLTHQRTPVQVISSSGRWHRTTLAVPTPADPIAPFLEFVATDGGGAWDKPTTGRRSVPSLLTPLSVASPPPPCAALMASTTALQRTGKQAPHGLPPSRPDPLHPNAANWA